MRMNSYFDDWLGDFDGSGTTAASASGSVR